MIIIEKFYETDKCQLYHGDCLEVMDELIKQGIKVDMILTDPPYGTTACKWDSIIPFEPMWERVNKLIKDNGTILFTASQPFTSALVMSNPKMFRYEWIWEKDKPSNFALANKQPMKYHENICVFYKNQPIYNKQITDGHKPMNGQAKYGRTYNGSVPSLDVEKRYTGGKTTRNPSSIQKFNTPKHNSSDKSGFHPTQKPIKLCEYFIRTYTNENELVLDFTMGSGTTGIACMNMNRKFIGIELDTTYCDTAKNRILHIDKNIA